MRIAVIGLGSIGQRRARILKAMGHNVIGIDISPKALRLDFHLDEVCDSVEELSILEQKPEVVFICTPPETHLELALKVAMLHCHIFIEKPLALHYDHDQLLFLMHVCDEAEVLTNVATNLRYHKGPATVKKWLDEGLIGTPIYGRFYSGSYLPDWVQGRDYKQSYTAKTGAILDVASHEIDLSTWMLGDANLKASVWKQADSIDLDCDGMAEMILEHASGTVSSVHVDFIRRDYARGCVIVGDKGTALWNAKTGRIELWRPDTRAGVCVQEWEDDWELKFGDSMEMMYRDEMQDFLERIEQGKSMPNPLSKAMGTLSLLMQAKEAGRS